MVHSEILESCVTIIYLHPYTFSEAKPTIRGRSTCTFIYYILRTWYLKASVCIVLPAVTSFRCKSKIILNSVNLVNLYGYNAFLPAESHAHCMTLFSFIQITIVLLIPFNSVNSGSMTIQICMMVKNFWWLWLPKLEL